MARASRSKRSRDSVQVAEGGRQNLDGDEAVEARVLGAVDFAHASHADGRDDLRLRSKGMRSG